MQTPILDVKDLTTRLKIGQQEIAVVDHLSFQLHAGKTLALVGESGCGKSMTALSLMRILPDPPALPSSGELIYKGKNLLSCPEKEMRKIRGGKMAMIFQDPSSALDPVYSIGNQLVEAAELHLGLYGDLAIQRAILALNEVGISSPEARLSDYPHQLSGGMRQRVMIAMALIGEPDILIADEPTTALDVTIQAQIIDLIKRLQKQRKMAVLLITHDMGIVAEMADDVIVMYAAQGVEKSSSVQIFDAMAHPYTQGLFGARPSLHQPKEKLPSIKGYVPSTDHFPEGCRFHPRCPYVMERCRKGVVPEFMINNQQHVVKCWLWDSQGDLQGDVSI